MNASVFLFAAAGARLIFRLFPACITDMAPLFIPVCQTAHELYAQEPDFHLSLRICCSSAKKSSPIGASDLPNSSTLSLAQSEKVMITSSPMTQLLAMNTDGVRIDVSYGRPELQRVLDETLETSKGKGGVGVGVCGPAGMVEEMERRVAKVDAPTRKSVGGVEIHAERFSL